MLGTVLLAVAAVIAVLAAIVALQPATFQIQRSTTIDAPPAAVFPLVNDFRHWVAWSPWERLDPTMRRTYDGPPSGVDAVYSWDGNKNVGAGRAAIVESRPEKQVRLKLEFLRPFVAANDVDFTFVAAGGKTQVAWTMTGTKNFMFKAMHLLMNVDKMCGGQFEEGLANLNEAAKSRYAALQHA